MTRAQVLIMAAIGAVAVLAYLQSLEVAKKLAGVAVVPGQRIFTA